MAKEWIAVVRAADAAAAGLLLARYRRRFSLFIDGGPGGAPERSSVPSVFSNVMIYLTL
jgi:hypothetical protein